MVTCGTPLFDCSTHTKDIAVDPTTVTCTGATCSDTECCTVTATATAATSASAAVPVTTTPGVTVQTVSTDLESLKTKVGKIELTLNEIKNEVTTLRKGSDVDGEDGEDGEDGVFSMNPLTWFGDEEEGFSNKDNHLFFIIAIMIILFYCLKR